LNPNSSFCSSLGYEFDALEPVLSRENVRYHFVQHHRSCYERTAARVRGTQLEALTLSALIRLVGAQPRYRDLFVLAAEAWNHDLYWRSLRPGGSDFASGPICADVERCFGSFGRFCREAQAQAGAVLGSGWLWVTWRAGRIEILTTGNADSPILHGHVPLLAIDLWEHAYYLDYHNARDAYVSACLTRLIDWGQANERLLEVKARAFEGPQAWCPPQATARNPNSSQKRVVAFRRRRLSIPKSP
jgi:superoxide dismutase, Fe-Mn family